MSSVAPETLPVVYSSYIPPAPLSEFVDLFWYYRGYELRYGKERILPMANSELVINLADLRMATASLAGPRAEHFIIERTEQDELLGIHFHFGGVFPFLEFPFGELHGRDVSLDDLWGGRRVNELLSRLYEARTIDAKFRALERWLIQVSQRPLKHHPAVEFALKEFKKDSGLSSSAEMSDRVGFSQRHFIQLFRDEVGMTPKLFCRVQRFHKVIQSVQKCKSPDWVDVALSCGYFDQSHFNHDFRQLCGLTPTVYLQVRTEHHNHLQEP